MRTLALSLLLLGPVAAAPLPALAAPAAKATPKPSGGLAFVANTGLEDIGTLSSSLRHAINAKRSGYLEEVVWIVYGRAIVALDPEVGAVPASIRADLQAAREAGVRIVACNQALEKFGIAPSELDEGVELVPNALTEVARLVSEGYALLRY